VSSVDDQRTERVVIPDAEELAIAHPGLEGEITRTGSGRGASTVTLRHAGELTLVSVDIGFPLLAWSEAASDAVVLSMVTRGVAGARWNGEDLDAGSVLVQSPGSSHHGVQPDGLRYEMIVAKTGLLESVASDLELGLSTHGGFLEHDAASRILKEYGSLGQGGSDDLLLAVVSVLSAEKRGTSVGSYRRVTSREVVRRVMGYLEATGTWMPSSLELCRAAVVSERRLQQAFHDVYDMPPSEFLRQRALSAARGLFERNGSSEVRVAEVAADLGFDHAGRFAHYYASLFGEAPSETLAAPSSSR